MFILLLHLLTFVHLYIYGCASNTFSSGSTDVESVKSSLSIDLKRTYSTASLFTPRNYVEEKEECLKECSKEDLLKESVDESSSEDSRDGDDFLILPAEMSSAERKKCTPQRLVKRLNLYASTRQFRRLKFEEKVIRENFDKIQGRIAVTGKIIERQRCFEIGLAGMGAFYAVLVLVMMSAVVDWMIPK